MPDAAPELGLTFDIGQFTAGSDFEVRPDRIEEELDRLWREIVRRGHDGRLAPVHRACLFNLVVHATDDAAEIVARYLAGALSDRLPSRVILVRAHPASSEAAPLRAWVAAVSDPALGSTRQVSAELIRVEAAGDALARVPPIVRAGLEPDMHTTLWWTGPPPEPRPYTRELLRLADRVVVDTDTCPDVADLAHLLPPAGSNRLADLAWPRLAPWRTAIARAFDDPEHRAFLGSVARVVVGVGGAGAGGGRPTATSAPLLAGWLAAALEWGACGGAAGHGVAFPCGDGDDGRVGVSIERRPGEVSGIADVVLSGAHGEARFERRARPLRVEATLPPAFSPVRPAPLWTPDPEDVLAAAVLEIHADPIAAAATRRAMEISASLGTT